MITTKQLEKLWDLLVLNYGGTHNRQKQLYFHYLKKYTYEEVSNAIELSIESYRYFPNINEIVSLIPKEDTQEKPKWFDEDLKVKTPSEEEQKELDELIKELSK